jgi:outer membrane protein TolC
LAVQKFQAEVFKNQSYQFYIQQYIVETENKLNYLLGRYPQQVERNTMSLVDIVPHEISFGSPVQLLEKRPDIKAAELKLQAAKLDIKVARARFYPSLGISAGVGIQAYSLEYIAKTPESLIYSLASDLMAPLVNRNAIKAAYNSANSRQIQALYEYQQTVLSAFIEVTNEISELDNLQSSYKLKEKEVEALTKSIKISGDLFKSARADYMEVLLTQRDALEATFELIETKMEQMHVRVDLYQALGGGWK